MPITSTGAVLTRANTAASLIKQFEGCRLKAYLCPAGIWTCGYGSTGPDVGPGTVWTQRQAEDRLASDLKTFIDGVAAKLTVPATPNQHAAMASLAYNIGLGNFGKSSVLRLHNQSDQKGAADAFLMWTKAGGKELLGLVRRRDAERSLYLTE